MLNLLNRRRSERYAIELPVLMKDAHGGEETKTTNVSAHGIAVVSARGRPIRHYVELEITLPDPARKIAVTAVVARTMDDCANDARTKVSGIGLDFFLFDARAKSEWQRFITRVRNQASSASAAVAPGLQRETSPERLPAVGMESEPDEVDDGSPTFIIQPRDLGRLWTFFHGELSKGRVRIEAPIVRHIGDAVELLVIHPETHAEWSLAGRVLRAIEHGRGGKPVLEIEIAAIGEEQREQFRSFVATGEGSIEEDVPITSEPPNLLGGAEPVSDSIEIDVFSPVTSGAVAVDPLPESAGGRVPPPSEEWLEETLDHEGRPARSPRGAEHPRGHESPGVPAHARNLAPSPGADASADDLKGGLFASFFVEAAASRPPQKKLVPIPRPSSDITAPAAEADEPKEEK